MKSVFASSNPFVEDDLGKAFYYPTQAREVEFDRQKVCLSPKFTNKANTEGESNMLQAKDFLAGSNSLRQEWIPTKDGDPPQHDHSGSSKFEESWPSTEHTTSPHVETPSSLEAGNERGAQLQNWLKGRKEKTKEGPKSTIARYIQRFRNEPPKSREERDKKKMSEEDDEFWWATQISSSSTPKESDSSTFSPPVRLRDSVKGDMRITPLTGRNPRKYLRKDKFTGEEQMTLSKTIKADSDTDLIQKRAQKLIDLSESTMTSSSTELQMNPASQIKSGSVPLPHSSISLRLGQAKDNGSTGPPAPRPRPAPEDDILYQWRLARKMERARNGGDVFSKLPHLSNQTTYLSQKSVPQSASGTAEVDWQIDPRVNSTPATRTDVDSAPVSKTAECQTVSSLTLPCHTGEIFVDYSNVPSHMHTACDILPCLHKHVERGKTFSTVPEKGYFCPKQRSILCDSTLEKPIAMAEPLTRDLYYDLDKSERGIDGTGEHILKAKAVNIDRGVDNGTRSATREASRKSEVKETCMDENGLESERIKSAVRVFKGVDDTDNGNKIIKEAINEVISENLFTSSISSGVSDLSEDQISCKKKQTEKCEDAQPTSENIGSDSSDGEFPDDEILLILRSRRKEYRQILSDIEKVLDEFPEGEGN